MSEKSIPIGTGARFNEWTKDQEAREVFKIKKKFLRPEFINRLDSDQIMQIMDIIIKDLESRLHRLGVSLDFSQGARLHIINSIDAANYGAHPLKRKLEEVVENAIVSLLIQDRRERIRTKVVDVLGGEIRVRVI